MTSATNYLENKVNDHVLAVTSYTAPSAVYLALFSTAPSDAGGGTELSGSGYAREEISFGASSGGVSANDADVEFEASGGDWVEATHFAIFDASTSGNMLFHGALANSAEVTDGGTLTFAIGDITVTSD